MKALLFFGTPLLFIALSALFMWHMTQRRDAGRGVYAEAEYAAALRLPGDAGRGRALYVRHACASCHGASGAGASGDLRAANTKFPDDADLAAWIRRPDAGAAMPAFDGVIAPEDFPDLIAYVRRLAAAPGR